MSKVFLRKRHVVARRIAGETILVPVSGMLADMSRIFSLNESAEFIWNAIESPLSPQEVALRMTEVFDTSMEQASEDAAALLAEMYEANLVDARE